MITDLGELIKREELHVENIRKINEWYMEVPRERAFPIPSPYGTEWETQRAIEACDLIARWSQGRSETHEDLMEFRDESLRILLVVLDGIWPRA